MATDTRAAAARVLAAVLGGASLNQALPPMIERVNPRDRALLQQLCYGSLRRAPELLAVLGLLLDKPLRDKDSDIQGLLMCGLYQLGYTRIPDHAAVGATVDASKALKKNWARGMTNAVLRRYLREREQLQEALEEPAAAAHPAWIYNALQEQWPDAARDIVTANNEQPPMTLRVNARKIGRDDYLAKLESAGIGARAGALSPQAIILEQPQDVVELPGFTAGEVSVQDEAAQMAAPLLGSRPGERVLDACAAPGGKSCHILELQADLSELVAMDIDAQRLQRVADNLQRLELQATLQVGDGASPPEALARESFDRILVDAPCSASGVIRRHPDIKVLRRESDIAGFASQQLAILKGLWPLLKPGGHMLYASCSLFKEENSELLQQFLGAADDASALPLAGDWGLAAGIGRQLLPAPGGSDGLFYAMIRKAG